MVIRRFEVDPPLITIVGIGMSRTISMSNTIKIMAKRKNRIENGIRAVLLGSNPHSKGEDFSRSLYERALRTQAASKIIDGNTRETAEEIINIFIN